jgi:hypothetical protein
VAYISKQMPPMNEGFIIMLEIQAINKAYWQKAHANHHRRRPQPTETVT